MFKHAGSDLELMVKMQHKFVLVVINLFNYIIACPNGSYTDPYTRYCVSACYGNLPIYDDTRNMCVDICPKSAFLYNNHCIAICPSPFFGDPSLSMCVNSNILL